MDGWTDLIAAFPGGTVLVARAPVPNRNPVVSAGPDQTTDLSNSETLFEAVASDADNDWLEFDWRDASGARFGPFISEVGSGSPRFCCTPRGTYTVTVTDGRGGTASDSMTLFPGR